MIATLADEVTVRFAVQCITMIVAVVNLVSIRVMVRISRRLEKEQQYLLDYRKELAAIRDEINKLHPDG
jgi:hypothetical protein